MVVNAELEWSPRLQQQAQQGKVEGRSRERL